MFSKRALRRLLAGVAFALLGVLIGSPATGDTARLAKCVGRFFEKPKDEAADATAKDAERVVAEVANSVGLRATIVVIPCDLIEEANAYVPEKDSGVVAGEYILYNPIWFRRVVGRERMQGYWIFGHELAHILNRDFLVRPTEEQITKERWADMFAGCAVAKMKGDLKTLDQIVFKMRFDKVDPFSDHPDFETSKELSRTGYLLCQGEPATQPLGPLTKVCSGEHRNRCQAHDVFVPCGQNAKTWAESRCSTYKIVRLNTYGGNQCGYTIDSVYCHPK